MYGRQTTAGPSTTATNTLPRREGDELGGWRPGKPASVSLDQVMQKLAETAGSAQ